MDVIEPCSVGAAPFYCKIGIAIDGAQNSASRVKTTMKIGCRKRILFWSERFWPTIGGVGISASKLLPALQARGYEFVVVTSKDYFDLPEERCFQGIPVYRFPFWSSPAKADVSQIVGLRRRIAHLKQTFLPNLVHIGFLGASVAFHLHTADVHSSLLLVSTDSSFPAQELGRDSLTGRTLRLA